jgi:uroporphyrin-3 C-methyltransferase/uroporphyrinogen III methyltransferase/synthase
VRSVQESTKELQGKVALLESKQQEAQSQQLALEQLYQDLSKNRDEWALTEIEQVLSTASQQLQLAGNVPGALIALQNADRSLSRSDKPQFITIRRAIARDTDKLKALPSVDSVGVALRLDNAIAQIDTLPMLSTKSRPCRRRRKRKPRPRSSTARMASRSSGRNHQPVAASAARRLERLEQRDVDRRAPADPRAQCRYAGCADAVADPGLLPAREPQAAPAECAHGAAVA